MRPFVTWLIVGALAVVGLFAARDALRDDGTAPAAQVEPRRPSGPPRIVGRAELARQLAAERATGALYVTDGTCHRYVLRLPDLVWTTPAGLPGPDCGFGRKQVTDASGLAAVELEGGRTQVFSEGWHMEFVGTAPAFKPGGTLTFVRAGRLYEWSGRCPPGAETVAFRGLRTIERCPRVVADAPRLVHEVVWTGEHTYAAIAGPERAASLVIVDGRRRTSIFNSVGASVSRLEASPGGRYFGLTVSGTQLAFDSSHPGRLSVPDGVERPRTVTWSPDDRFAALVSEGKLFVYRADRPNDVVVLPIFAVALEWR